MKKISAILICVILTLTFSSCTTKNEENTSNIFVPDVTVNGERITRAEYEYFYKALRSDIITEYAEKYSVTDFGVFWETEYNGKTPSAELQERTLDKCIRAKIELNLCEENGIYDDVSFDALKKKAEEFNAENEDKDGVVGLKSISLDTFYTYYIETGVMELKNRLEKSELKPSEDEIQNQINSMTKEMKSKLTQEEIRNYAVDKAVDEKYEKLIEYRISSAQTVKN